MLKINELRKNYDDFSLNCSLEIKSGYITALIGQNGAGKSTIFKSVLGLIKMDGGSVFIDGKDVAELDAKDRQKLGVAMSDSGFSRYLAIKDIIPIMSNMYEAFDKELFLKRAQQFRLPLNKKIKEFSTGMEAKLKVLVATCHKAKLLLLDEPTAGLDVIARDEILQILREYMEEDEGRAILISSHISGDLESLCDDVYMIHNGEIILHQEMNSLLDEYGVIKVTKEDYDSLDKQYILRFKKEAFGYVCLTNQKQYYIENYPKIVVEKGCIDEIITLMIKGVEQ